jgi:hypothetical protein
MAKLKAYQILQILGVGVLCVYLAAALGVLPVIGAEKLMLGLVFGIGPVAIVGVLGIQEFLKSSASAFALRVAITFLVIAFALFNLMLVVQQMVRLQFRQFRSETADAATIGSLDAVFKGTNLIQQGIDVSFDVFYCLGIIVLSAVIYRHRDLGRILGGLGIISAAGLLVLNLWTFPYPPANSGLIDLGPITGVWWLLVCVQIQRVLRRARVSEGGAGAT